VVIGNGHQDLSFSPALSAFAAYAQRQLTPTISSLTDHLVTENSRINNAVAGKTPVLGVVAQILTILKSLPGNKTTIDQVAQKYLASLEMDGTQGSRHRILSRHAVFHAVALASMLYKTETNPSLACFHVHIGRGQKRQIELSSAQRPIIAHLRLLGSFQANVLAGPNLAVKAEDHTKELSMLDVTNLGFSALAAIGQISLVWVDSLDQHLEFDPDFRQLGVFRFPSFCAAAYLCEGESLVSWFVVPCKMLGHARLNIVQVDQSQLGGRRESESSHCRH
jgi:hypothetical protein